MSTTQIQDTQATRTSTWDVDSAHTLAQFSVRHMMIATVRGRFGRVRGTVRLDEGDPTLSSVALEIDAESIDTREEKRDAHLRSPDFFDVENHPKIRFQSTRIVRTGDDRYEVTGDLTMRGVTREVVVSVSDEGRAKSPWGQEVAGFSAEATLDRREFGLQWNQALETGGVLVANEVKIHFEIEAVKQA